VEANQVAVYEPSKDDIRQFEQWGAFHKYNNFYLERMLGIHVNKQIIQNFIGKIGQRTQSNKAVSGKKKRTTPYSILYETWNVSKKSPKTTHKYQATKQDLMLFSQFVARNNGAQGWKGRVEQVLGIFMEPAALQQFITEVEQRRLKNQHLCGRREKIMPKEEDRL
jgi:hypothetical protein